MPSPPANPAAADPAEFWVALEHDRAGRLIEAESAYKHILARSPNDPNAHFNLGNVLARMGRHHDSAAAFGRAAELKPAEAVIQVNLGNALYLIDRLSEAVDCFLNAVRLQPEFPGLHANLASAYHKLDQSDKAIAALRKAVAADPANPALRHNLGHSLARQGFPVEAVGVFRAAVAENQSDAAAFISLGNLLFKQDRKADALAAIEKALQIDPQNIYAHNNLARKLQESGQTQAAIAAYRRALEVEPENPIALHMLAALTGQGSEIAPAGYVKTAFDLYADKFDNHLVEKLEYATPTLLRKALDETCGKNYRAHSLMDLGCGTGISGEAFTALTNRLVGLDLSPKMLAKAAAKKIYTALHEGEIIDFLQSTSETFDLFVAADVFVYIGNLANVFAAVTHCARPGARLAFSVEDHAGAGFVLNPSGRYAHSVKYVTAAATESSFSIDYCQPANLRKESGKWVCGSLFILSVNPG